MPVGSQTVSGITATCVGPNGIGAMVSTAIGIEATLINVWKRMICNTLQVICNYGNFHNLLWLFLTK